MKANFRQPFKNCDSKPMEKELSIAEALAQHLFNGSGLKPANDPAKDMKAKYDYFRLSQKLQSCGEETDYTPEELVIIKEVAATAFVPGGFGQVCDIAEGKEA